MKAIVFLIVEVYCQFKLLFTLHMFHLLFIHFVLLYVLFLLSKVVFFFYILLYAA